MAKVGDRIIALLEVKDNIVYSFGKGLYAGTFPVSKEAGGFNFGQKNPRLDLDNGQTVWGCESWWGGEENIKKKYPIDKFQWKTVNINDYR